MEDILQEAHDILKAYEKAQRHSWTRDTVDTTMLVDREDLHLALELSTVQEGLESVGWDIENIIQEDLCIDDAEKIRVPAQFVVAISDELKNLDERLHNVPSSGHDDCVDETCPDRLTDAIINGQFYFIGCDFASDSERQLYEVLTSGEPFESKFSLATKMTPRR